MSIKKDNETIAVEEREDKASEFVEKVIKDKSSVKEDDLGVEPITAEEKKIIDKRILEIYENPDGSLPDMKNFQTRKRFSFFKAFARLAIACAFLGGVAWAGFFMLQPKSSATENDVVLTITGSDKIVAGTDNQFRIRYRNAEGVNLKNVTLQVNYPDDFVFSSSSVPPEKNSKEEWKIGDLAAGDSGFVDVIGKLYGEVGKDQSFRVFLSYTPDNFSSQFQKSAVVVKHVTDSPVILDVQNKATNVSGANNQIDVLVKPVADAAISNIAVVLVPGDHFTKISSNPAADKLNTSRWLIDSLSAETKISVSGYLAPSSGSGSVLPQIKVYEWKDSKRSGAGYLLVSKTIELPRQAITAGEVTVAVNGSTSDAGVQPGEELTFSLKLKNNGSESLKNASARIVIDAPSKNKKSLLDWTAIKDGLDGDIKGEQLSDRVRRGSILWGTAKSKDLAEIAPGQEFNLQFTMPIKLAKDFDLTGINNPQILISSEVQYDLVGKKEIASSLPLTLSLGSDMSFNVRDNVVADPAGQKHNLSLVISNSYHPLKDITVEADVYGDAAWSAADLQVPAGTANFDAGAKKITWKVAEMPESLDVLALQCAVVLKTVNPTQTNLTSKIKLTATDAVTGDQINKIVDGIALNR